MAVIHPRRADKFLFIIIYLKVFYRNHSLLTHGLFRIKCLQFSEIEGYFNQLYLIGSCLNCGVVKGCRTLCIIKTTHFSVINFMAWHIFVSVLYVSTKNAYWEIIGPLLPVYPFDKLCNWIFACAFYMSI